MRSAAEKFQADERGATSIEYGLIAAVVGLGLVVTLSSIPTALNDILAAVAGHME